MAHVALDADLKDALRRFRASRPWHSKIENKLDAVVLVSDLGGASLLTLDGRLLQDSPFDGLGEIASVIQRRMVLFLGAQEIPELARVLPRRTPDAVDCVECERTGWLRVKADFQIPCARCGGLG